jgi:hypothetical protein
MTSQDLYAIPGVHIFRPGITDRSSTGIEDTPTMYREHWFWVKEGRIHSENYFDKRAANKGIHENHEMDEEIVINIFIFFIIFLILYLFYFI